MRDKYLRKLNIELVDGDFKNLVKRQVRGPEDLFEAFKELKDEAKGTTLGVYFTDKLETLVYSVLGIGDESVTPLLPHQVFRHALISGASYFVVVQNHPGGDPQPSESEIEVMDVFRGGAQAIKLGFLDFIIVGGESYWSSFEEEGGATYFPGVSV